MSSPMMRTFASRSISSIVASRIASRYDFSLMLILRDLMVALRDRPRPMLGDDVVEQLLRRGLRALLRELHRVRGLLGRPLVHLVHVVVGQAAHFAEAIAEDDDWIAVAVLLDFFLRAIRLQDVGRAVAGEAIGHGLDAIRLSGLAHPPHHPHGAP